MRIARLRVDGFGALRDAELELPPGLSVVLGPNEAGKSTLLHFCAGMLYGFPKKGHVAYHPAVRGGRHGGTLDLLDDAGGIWSIERYTTPSRTLVVYRPDGSEASEHDLRNLLGGSSAELFASVFAVDLDGLSQVRNVSSEEVREVLFSSAVMGQRRSAAKASRDLAGRQVAIARPRGDAKANRLYADLLAVRAELVAARTATAAHQTLRSELEGLEAERDSLRESERVLLEEGAELGQLRQLWERLSSGRDAADQLADMPPLDVTAKRLLECEADIRKAANAFSGYRTRLGQRQDLKRQMDGLAERITHALGSLWPEATAEQALAVRHDMAMRDTLNQLASSHRSLGARLGDARPAAASAATEAARAAANLAELEARAGIVPPPADELDARLSALRELRRRLADSQSIRSLAQLEEQRAASLPGRTSATPGIALVALGLLVLLVAAIAGAARLPVGLCAGLAGLGAFVAVAGAVVAFRRSLPASAGKRPPAGTFGRAGTDPASARNSAGSPGRGDQPGRGDSGSAPDSTVSPDRPDSSSPGAERYRAQLEQLDTRVAELSVSLGLPRHPTPSDVEIEVDRTERDHARRLELDDATRSHAEATRRARSTSDFVHEIEEELLGVERRFRLWKQEAAVPPASSFEAAASALEGASAVRKDLSAEQRVERALEDLGAELAAFETILGQLANDLEEDLPSSTDDRQAWLEDLDRRLAEYRSRRQRREDLEATVTRTQADVERSLGAGSRSEALRRRLSEGAVLEWEARLRHISEQLAALRDGEEDVVRRHEALRRRREELLQSDRIAELESEEARLEHELDAALSEYMTLGLARHLITSTLERHESERQPEVIRRASEHFARITNGRYARVSLDPTDSSRPSMRVRSASGETVEATDLSRGTVEQLYLSLRLGLAEEFAERSVALPVVLDDVLVNFDRERTESVIGDLVVTAARHQVIVFTCHEHLAEMIKDVHAQAQSIRLARA